MNIELYTDKDIENLKEQIRFLEIEISLIASERAEIEKQIRQYEIRFNKEVGDLAERVLEKRMQQLRKDAEKNPNKQSEFQQAEKEYDEFKQSHEESKNSKEINLNEEEQLQIKTKFRKACQLCHPDKVSHEYKESAHKLFVELKDAYAANDLTKVSDILAQLEKGIFKTGSQSITEREKLLLLSNKLKGSLDKLRKELAELKQSEVYQTIAAVKNFDSHFEMLRKQLDAEIAH
jgi:hypothetical protein